MQLIHTPTVRRPSLAAAVLVLGLGLTLGPIALSSAAQAASGGNRVPLDLTGTFIVDNVCAFPITVDGHAVGAQTVVDTGHGSIVRIHLVETDVWMANGHSATGTYTFETQVTLDGDGNTVSVFQTGMIVRIPLPNGEVFQVSGRSVADQAFTATADHGVTKNTDALCAFLGA